MADRSRCVNRRNRAGSRKTPANDASPRWSPDGQALYFLSTRSGSSQVWRLALAGGEPTQVTDYPLDVGSFKVSPAGDRLALSHGSAARLRRSRLHEIEARCAGREQGHRPLIRAHVRAALGYVEQRHALASVRRDAGAGRQSRRAGRLSPARSMPIFLPSRSAATKNSRSARMAHTSCSRRAWRGAKNPGPPTSTSTRCRWMAPAHP